MDLTSNEYCNIHRWLSRNHGKADHCAMCKLSTPDRSYQYALIKGKKHCRDIQNYMQMCVSCHKKYDMTEKSRKNLSLSKMGKTYAARPVRQVDKYSNIQIRVYTSTREASRKLGILHTAINNALTGRSKSAGGFVWEFIK